MKLVRIAIAAAAVLAAVPAAAQRVPIIVLDEGFVPDPRRQEIYVGGTLSAEDRFGENCTGAVREVPSARLRYQAGRERLFISLTSEVDNILVVRTPSGRILCNDDRSDDTLDAGLEIEQPESGEYEIYAGLYDEADDGADGYLRISEIGYGDEEERRREEDRSTASP